MINIEDLTLRYFQNDEPCPYHLKCGIDLLIYPIKVKDWSIFDNSVGILQIEKNDINDINIIQMSYLEFIARVLIPQDKNYGSALVNVFKYALQEDDIRVTQNKKEKIDLIIVEKNDKKEDIIKEIITSKEFDDIKKIILYQNIIDYDDRYLSPEVKEEIQSYYSLKYKNTHSPNLEQKKTYTISKTGILMKDINNMTYRTFSQVYQSCVDTDIYFGQKIIQGSYKYKVDEDIKYPLYEKKKDILDEVFSMSDEQMVNKVNQVNG